MPSLSRFAPPLLAALLLSACTTLDTRVSRESVQQAVSARTGQPVALATPEPVRAGPYNLPTADDAVRLALTRSPAVAATLAELDAAEVQAVQAGLLKNPFFHASLLYPHDSHGKAIDLGLSWDVLGLLTLGPRREAADRGRQAARLKAVAGLLELAAQSRAAWFAHLAEREGADWLADLAEATDLGAEIAQRLEQAGNLPPLAAASAQAVHLETREALDAARLAAQASRDRLARRLGVAAPEQLQLPERLPRLPDKDPAAPDAAALEATDLGLATLAAELEQVRQRGEAVGRMAWTDGVELGWNWERETSGEWKDGPSLGVALPLFDTGEARRAGLRFEAARLEARMAERGLALAREARDAAGRMQRARARVENLREKLLPLLSDAQDQALLQYNAMQKSPFHLLDLKQRELAALRQLVAGLGDYWQARTSLEALNMGVSLESGGPTRAAAMAATPQTSSGGH